MELPTDIRREPPSAALAPVDISTLPESPLGALPLATLILPEAPDTKADSV